MYIFPNNSLYYNEIYFKNLQLILDYFRGKHLIIIGDLNSRIGNLDGKFGFKYIPNSNTTINVNGKVLILQYLMVLQMALKYSIQNLPFTVEMCVHKLI